MRRKAVRILVDVTEAAERLEELIELALRGDEIVICRDERASRCSTDRSKPILSRSSLLWQRRVAKMYRLAQTSDHSDFYDEHGLPK